MRRLFHIHDKNRRGAAAVEFVLILPVFLIICLGMFEVAGVVNANMKVTSAAQLLGDLVAQQTNESATLTTNFCNGAKLALSPLSSTTLKADIVSVTHYSTGTTVDWQDTTCGGASTISNGASLASTLVPNVGDSVIIVVATYNYASPVSYVLRSSYTLAKTVYSRPRNVTNITHS